MSFQINRSLNKITSTCGTISHINNFMSIYVTLTKNNNKCQVSEKMSRRRLTNI